VLHVHTSSAIRLHQLDLRTAAYAFEPKGHRELLFHAGESPGVQSMVIKLQVQRSTAAAPVQLLQMPYLQIINPTSGSASNIRSP
jgi:hypothetical protein